MITYDNYYGVNKQDTPEKYDAVLENLYDFLYCMCDAEKGTPLTELDLRAGAERYLAKGGLTQDEISRIYDYVTA